jgi:hypothetical protein
MIAGAGDEARATANGLIEAAEATHNPFALHLWPEADDRTRKAVDELLDQSLGSAADGLRTGGRN